MSSTGRKDLSDRFSEAVKPDAQKTATEKAGEHITNAYDRVAAAVQPNSEKSVLQRASDDARSSHKQHEHHTHH